MPTHNTTEFSDHSAGRENPVRFSQTPVVERRSSEYRETKTGTVQRTNSYKEIISETCGVSRESSPEQ